MTDGAIGSVAAPQLQDHGSESEFFSTGIQSTQSFASSSSVVVDFLQVRGIRSYPEIMGAAFSFQPSRSRSYGIKFWIRSDRSRFSACPKEGKRIASQYLLQASSYLIQSSYFESLLSRALILLDHFFLIHKNQQCILQEFPLFLSRIPSGVFLLGVLISGAWL